MRKAMVGLLALIGAASGGCVVAEVDGPHHPHVHCVGCGHIYVHGEWR